MIEDEMQAIRQWLSKPYPNAYACCCIGSKNNEPLCVCAMRWMEQVNGKWYKITEHRSPEGVTHSAELFVSKEKERINYENLSYKEKLMLKHGHKLNNATG